jgi:hypothetical protein
MKTLNIHFTDKEYLRLSKARKEHVKKKRMISWHRFLLEKCAPRKLNKRRENNENQPIDKINNRENF